MNRNIIAFAIASILAGCGGGGEGDGDTSSSTGNSNSGSTIIPKIEIPRTLSFTEPTSGEKDYSFRLKISPSMTQAASIKLAISDVTATRGEDYLVDLTEIDIPIDTTSVTVPLKLLADNIYEGEQTFKITMTSPNNIVLKSGYEESLVTIVDRTDKPTVSFTTDFASVKDGSGKYGITLVLSHPSQLPLDVPFSLTGLATPGVDYELLTTSPVSFSPEVVSNKIDLDILPSLVPEGGENVLVSIEQGTLTDFGDYPRFNLTIPGSISLNDTGLTQHYDGTSFYDVALAEYPMQDALFGRDVEATNHDDGHAAFSQTKVDASGNSLPDSEMAFECIRDNVTGLVWEKKHPEQLLPDVSGDDLKDLINDSVREGTYPFDQQNANWRGGNYTYYWYSSDDDANGGSRGAKGQNFVNTSYPISEICAFRHKEQNGYISSARTCDTESYVLVANSLNLCGYDDWRLPTATELRSRFNYQVDNDLSTTDFSPNTQANSYLTSTPVADAQGAVWCLEATTGEMKQCNKSLPYALRLVRGEKL